MTAEAASGGAPRRALILALGLMLLAGFASSILHLGVRLVSPQVPTMVVVFLRALFTLMFTLPFVLGMAGVAWRTQRPGLQLLRALIGTLSLSAWYYALAHMPLAEAGALSFTTGLFVTIGAALWLRERVGMWRILAVALGFAGALVVLKPGMAVVSLAAGAALGSSALWAVSLLMAKELTRFDSSLTVAFYQPLLIAPLALIGAVPMWVWPQPRVLAILVGMGLVAAIGNYAYIHALKLADASVVMPVDYVRLLWMAGWGFLIFSEIPALSTWAGAGLIIAAAVTITWTETRPASSTQRDKAGA